MNGGKTRTVKCSKLGRELPGLENPPFVVRRATDL